MIAEQLESAASEVYAGFERDWTCYWVMIQVRTESVAMLGKSKRGATPDAAESPGAIVLGGAHGCLAIARSLGRRGIPVLYIDRERTFAAASRYVRAIRWPVDSDPERVNYLLDIGARVGARGWVLFAASDLDARLLSANARALQAMYRLTLPPWESLAVAYDKRLTYAVATQLGIAIPWTAYPRSRDEISRLVCPLPAILKPAVKEEKNEFTQAKAWRADTRSQLIALYDRAAALVDPATIMVQELIPGAGGTQHSYAAAWWRGAPLASMVACRRRQFPVDFGFSSTCVETTDAPAVQKDAMRILQAIGYQGLVEVEFKYDARDGRHKLLDINPRCWTWQALASRSGVDLAYLLWLAAQQREAPRMEARQGVRWIYFSRDLVAGAIEIRRGATSLRSYVKSILGAKCFAVFAPDDPAPAMLELPLLLSRHRTWKAPAGARRMRAPEPIPQEAARSRASDI